TPNYPDLETYCEKVKLEKYDTFLILTMKRFTENDRLLAEKVKSLNKSFFFIRTHIDADYLGQKRNRSFDEQAMLQTIKEDCLQNLEGSAAGDNAVFLMSNLYPAKWDFARLTQAILDVLPDRQRECLTLSLGVLTSLSTDMLKRKAAVLRGRIWMIASASAAAAAVPLPGLNVIVDLALLTNEVSLYKSQLGLPHENSYEFRKMTPENQEKVRKFCITSSLQMASFLATYTASSTAEEFTRFIPLVGPAIASSISFCSTYNFLHQCLKELEETALEFLDEMTSRTVDDID
ncbi:interferon-inducible GTPase 5-like, partial [Paramuricea clavata]